MNGLDAPHRVVDRAVDGLANGARGVVNSVKNGLESAGEQVQVALDQPLHAVGIKSSPLRTVDRVIDGALDAGAHLVTEGFVGSAQIFGEGVARAFDNPVDTWLGDGPQFQFRFPQFPGQKRR